METKKFKEDFVVKSNHTYTLIQFAEIAKRFGWKQQGEIVAKEHYRQLYFNATLDTTYSKDCLQINCFWTTDADFIKNSFDLDIGIGWNKAVEFLKQNIIVENLTSLNEYKEKRVRLYCEGQSLKGEDNV